MSREEIKHLRKRIEQLENRVDELNQKLEEVDHKAGTYTPPVRYGPNNRLKVTEPKSNHSPF